VLIGRKEALEENAVLRSFPRGHNYRFGQAFFDLQHREGNIKGVMLQFRRVRSLR